MDGLNTLLFFLGGVVVGVLGLTAYKGAFDLSHSKIDDGWIREQKRMQIQDDRRKI
jgi:hypothetical protein